MMVVKVSCTAFGVAHTVRDIPTQHDSIRNNTVTRAIKASPSRTPPFKTVAHGALWPHPHNLSVNPGATAFGTRATWTQKQNPPNTYASHYSPLLPCHRRRHRRRSGESFGRRARERRWTRVYSPIQQENHVPSSSRRSIDAVVVVDGDVKQHGMHIRLIMNDTLSRTQHTRARANAKYANAYDPASESALCMYANDDGGTLLFVGTVDFYCVQWISDGRRCAIV